MKTRILVYFIAAISALMLIPIERGAAGLQAQSPPDSKAGARFDLISRQATTQSRAYRYLQELCDEIGGRLTGPSQDLAARDWALKKMRDVGLQNVATESFRISRGWTRIQATAELVAPGRQRLTVDALGWTGSTRAGGVEAEVIAVNRNQLEVEQKSPGRWSGKILLLVSKGTPRSSLVTASQIDPFFKAAQKGGAIAIIGGYEDGTPDARGMNLTHISTASLNSASISQNVPIEFAMNYLDIPMVDMSPEYQMTLERLLDQGKTVRLRLDVQNRFSSQPVTTGNIVGEIRGTSSPEQVVVVGAHLDSWDTGAGATDDGFGVAATLAAAEAISRAGLRPRRTLRFVLFNGEEQILLGSRAYVKQHQAELMNHVATVMMDSGAGPISSLILNGRADLIAAVEGVLPLLKSSGAKNVNDSMFLVGDSLSFAMAGVPTIDFGQDSANSRFTHHSAADTLDKVDPDTLVKNAAAMAVLAFWLADRPERLPAWPPERTIRMLEEQGLAEVFKAINLWPF